MALTGNEIISVESAFGQPIGVTLAALAATTAYDDLNVTEVGSMASPRLAVSALKNGLLPAAGSVPQADARLAALSHRDLNTYFGFSETVARVDEMDAIFSPIVVLTLQILGAARFNDADTIYGTA
jgi:hypothetical protein